MRMFKTVLASCLFIPFTFIGQVLGYYFGLFTLFMWKVSVRGGSDGNDLIPFFSDFFPYVLSGIFGGVLSAFLIRNIYKFYHPKIILIVPIIVGLLATLGNIYIMIKVGISVREVGLLVGSVLGVVCFVIALREDYPPILKELESTNKKLKDPTLEKLYGDRVASGSIKKIEGVSDHRNILENVLETAKEKIIIFSGFTSKYVINKNFLQKIKQMLEKGVDIYLCFGYRHPSDSKTKSVLNKSEIAELIVIAKEIKEKPNCGKLLIYDFPNHSKILIKDEEFFIAGSFNWLSTGDQSINLETSFLIKDEKSITNQINDTLQLFSKYKPIS